MVGGMQLLGNGCSQAMPCRKQRCMPAHCSTGKALALSCLTPVIWVLQVCCCILMRNEEADVGKKKLQKALEKIHVFSPLQAAVSQSGKLKGNARNQYQRGPQLPISLDEVWQMFMGLTLTCDCVTLRWVTTVFQLSSRNRLNKKKCWASVN